jgi:hypothetical protein
MTFPISRSRPTFLRTFDEFGIKKQCARLQGAAKLDFFAATRTTLKRKPIQGYMRLGHALRSGYYDYPHANT